MAPPHHRHPSQASTLAFLNGGGEMGDRVRRFDWAASPLGPPAGWPEALKTAVSICLGSKHPMVIWWGKEGLIQFYNDAYIAILGRTKHPQSLGQSGCDTWQEIWPTMAPMIDAVFQTGEANWAEEFLYVLDRTLPKEESYFTFSYSPIRDADGSVAGIFCACSEATEKVISARRLKTLNALAENMLQARTSQEVCQSAVDTLVLDRLDIPFAALYRVDDQGTHLKRCASEGIDPQTASLPESLALSPQALQPAWPLEKALRDRTACTVYDLKTKLGALMAEPWLEPIDQGVIVPFFSAAGTVAGVLVLGVSPRRPLDENYRGFFELLASRIGSAFADAAAYEEAHTRAEQLAALNYAKTQFFSNVSHEFRTPLTLMLGPLEDVLGRIKSEEDRAQIAMAHRNSLRLMRLVNTLLDFSRIEAGRQEATFQPTDLAALTADIASTFRSACERAHLAYEVDCPPLPEPVFVDPELWERIVLNLISNAFKFTLQGRIQVRIRAQQACVHLEVCDSGTGIPADELPRLFERFHRVSGATGRSFEGSGIGLALVHDLVRLHGGTVAVESEINRGTTFRVELPLGRRHLPEDRIALTNHRHDVSKHASSFVEEALRWLPDQDEVATIGDTHEASPLNDDLAAPGGHVLVADDNADLRGYVRHLLEKAGYEVDTVGDGDAALARIRTQRPDLLLADVMMPRLDGLGLLKAIREDAELDTLPVILLSARAGENAQVEGLAARADDYLTKPFSANELLARVAAHLALAKLRRENVEAIRAGEARFRIAVQGADSGVWDVDVGTEEGFWSDRFFTLLGLEAPANNRAMINLWRERLHPADAEAVMATFRQAMEAGVPYRAQYRIFRADTGECRWMSAYGRAMLGADGSSTRSVGVMMDVTDAKAGEERHGALARLSDDLINQRTVQGVLDYVARFAIDNVGGAFATYVPADRIVSGPTTVLGQLRLSDFAASLREQLMTGRVVGPVPGHLAFWLTSTPRGLYDIVRCRSFVCAPTLRDGRLSGCLMIVCPATHEWLSGQKAFLKEVAERTQLALERVTAEGVAGEQDRLLRLIASGEPLVTCLTAITETITRLQPQTRACILLADRQRKMFVEGYASDVPATFAAAVKGATIEDLAMGTCGTAVHRAEPVTCEDIAHDDRWAPAWRDLCIAHGIRACRSQPIIGAYGVCFGSLMLCLEDERLPTQAEMRLAEFGARIAALALQRDETQHELAQSEERYRLIVESAKDFAIVTLDMTGKITGWNVGAQALMGYTEEEVLGQDGAIFFTPEDVAAGRPQVEMERACHVGRAENERWHVRKDGTTFWGSGLVQPLTDGHQRGYVKIFRDRTREKASEEALQQLTAELASRVEKAVSEREAALAKVHELQKLETIGQLTGGIAHDFNNLLAPIVGALDIVRRRYVADERGVRMVEGAQQAADRARTLIGRLLAFARRQHLDAKLVDLGDLIRGMADLIQRSLGPEIAIHYALHDMLPAVYVDANQLELAILNLCVNARDAMPEGGQLHIAVEVVEGSPAGLPTGQYVQLSITDSCFGMDAETLKQAVEPFFTTKGVGKGTGLGLSTVHGLAAQSGGTMKLKSTPGKGTTVSILLPAAEGTVADRDTAHSSMVPPMGALRILLVDDEELVRTATADILEVLGHEVVQAASASLALRLLRSSAAFDIMITDYLMPSMRGDELIREARKHDANLPCVLITGYIGTADVDVADVQQLSKPFGSVELAQAIEMALSDETPGKTQQRRATEQPHPSAKP